MKIFRNISWTPALIVLVVTNLVPVVGVIWLGWDAGAILVLYWLETVIIGLLNIPKIWACEGHIGTKIFLTPFFAVHFGGFCLGHAAFLGAMFGAEDDLKSLLMGGPLLWTGLTFFISHFVSMMVNFFGKKEYVGRQANAQMFFPYGRVVIMHVTIIIGGGLVMALGQPLAALIFLIGLKLLFDIIAHRMEHEGTPQHLIN